MKIFRLLDTFTIAALIAVLISGAGSVRAERDSHLEMLTSEMKTVTSEEGQTVEVESGMLTVAENPI